MTLDRALTQDRRVVLDVGRVGQALGEACDVGNATARGQGAAPLQLVGRGQEIDVSVFAGQVGKRLEDQPVRFRVEVVGPDRIDHAVEAVGVGQHSAKDRPLRRLAGRDPEHLGGRTATVDITRNACGSASPARALGRCAHGRIVPCARQ